MAADGGRPGRPCLTTGFLGVFLAIGEYGVTECFGCAVFRLRGFVGVWSGAGNSGVVIQGGRDGGVVDKVRVDDGVEEIRWGSWTTYSGLVRRKPSRAISWILISAGEGPMPYGFRTLCSQD